VLATLAVPPAKTCWIESVGAAGKMLEETDFGTGLGLGQAGGVMRGGCRSHSSACCASVVGV
jgi:hypothetical protein